MENMTIADRRRRRPRDPADRGGYRDVRGRLRHQRAARALRVQQAGRRRSPRPRARAASSAALQSSQALEPAQQGRGAAGLRRQPGARDRPRGPQAQAERVPDDLGRHHDRHPARHAGSCRSCCPRWATRSFLVIGALVGFMLPRFWLNRRKNGRLNAFNKQLPDTITLIANALRAGSSFLQAIELVVRESRPPISTEFGRVIREVNLGLSFDVALENMVRRVRSDDLELMATAISIQHTGRRQPRRDPGLDRVHHPRAGPHQGRDPDPHRAAAAVGLRGRLPADRPGRLPVHRGPGLHGADVRRPGERSSACRWA